MKKVSANSLGPDVSVNAHEQAMQLPVFKRCLERSGMTAEGFVETLTHTSLSGLVAWTQTDLERLLLTAELHGLNPTGNEIFLVPTGGVLGPTTVVVGVDGWSRIINSHSQFAGMRFRESSKLIDDIPSWIECSIFRWDRHVPTTVREYLEEVRGEGAAWITHPRRMLRHKAMIQCARLAFGLVGICDRDEAQNAGRASGDEGSPDGHSGRASSSLLTLAQKQPVGSLVIKKLLNNAAI